MDNNSQLPITVILGINLHGEFLIDDNNNVNMTKVKVQNLMQLNAVTCGVPNISTYETYDILTRIVDEYVNEHPLQWNTVSEVDLLSYINNIRDLLIENNRMEINDMNQQFKRMRRDDKLYHNISSYLHASDKAYNVATYIKDDLVADKVFYKFSQDELDVQGIDKDDEFFNRIFVYNTPDKQDIFELLGLFIEGLQEITLSNLLDFLNGMGIKNVVLVDLSCSVFRNATTTKRLDARGTRAVRRALENKTSQKQYTGKNKEIKKSIKRRRRKLKKNIKTRKTSST